MPPENMRSKSKLTVSSIRGSNSPLLDGEDLFNTEAWQTVLLDGFGTETFYIDPANTNTPHALTVFSAGPIKIGYLGFPLTDNKHNTDPHTLMRELDLSFLANRRIHALRFSSQSPSPKLPMQTRTQKTTETCIHNLQCWNASSDAKLRRTVNRKNRSALRIVDAATDEQADTMFELYRMTIKKHDGSMRYTQAYFRSLVNLSRHDKRVRCLMAMQNKHTAGFHIVACHYDTAIYLHGGSDFNFKHLYPSDILFLTAIEWAKSEGMRHFNMLSSPANQPSLIKYKEKWGGLSSELYTHTLVLSPNMMRVFDHILLPAHNVYKHLRHRFGD